jgi:hypothetical protein
MGVTVGGEESARLNTSTVVLLGQPRCPTNQLDRPLGWAGLRCCWARLGCDNHCLCLPGICQSAFFAFVVFFPCFLGSFGRRNRRGWTQTPFFIAWSSWDDNTSSRPWSVQEPASTLLPAVAWRAAALADRMFSLGFWGGCRSGTRRVDVPWLAGLVRPGCVPCQADG